MQASGQMIYCNGMDTFNPTEYLTLPAGPEQNFASTSKSGQPQCMTGTVKFEKIGLDLDVIKTMYHEYSQFIYEDEKPDYMIVVLHITVYLKYISDKNIFKTLLISLYLDTNNYPYLVYLLKFRCLVYDAHGFIVSSC